MRYLRFMIVAVLLVAPSVVAADGAHTIAQWIKQGLVLKIQPFEGAVLVQVSEKWVRLPLDKQTDMVRTIGDDMFAALVKADAGVDTLRTSIIRNEGSPELGIADTDGDGTVVVWSDWYSREQRRKEIRATSVVAPSPAP